MDEINRDVATAVEVLLEAWSAGTVRASGIRQQKLREWWPALGEALDTLMLVSDGSTTVVGNETNE